MPESNPTAPKSLTDTNDAPPPEDVATLYSWANLHGAKYRDFSASRANAREEARLRAEEAKAAERRRLEEEEERRRQEEAQIAARKAAEEAEAARPAEAERLAEIARQAEAERQAVLAAQEAQRQAALQRAWQPPPPEAYQGNYPPSFPPAPFEEVAGRNSVPGGDSFRQPFSSFAGPIVAMDSVVDSIADPIPTPIQAPSFVPPAQPEARTAYPASPSAAVNAPSARLQPYPEPYRAAEPVRQIQQHSPAPRESGSPQPSPYPSFAPFQDYPGHAENSYPSLPQDRFASSPWSSPSWSSPEMREVPTRPAWLAPEWNDPIPASSPAPSPNQFAAQPVNTPARRFQNQSQNQPSVRPVEQQASSFRGQGPASEPFRVSNPSTATPATQAQVPMYLQNVGYPAAPMADSFSGGNPGQTPSSAPGTAPVDDTLAGSRDRIANRWYALKSVFDPQPAPAEQVPAPPPARIPVLAVFSLAGGVGKTSLVASLGRALSSRGERVLLVDTSAYGLLPFFFGARDQRPGMLRTFTPPGVSAEAPIQLVTLDPDGRPPEASHSDSNQNPNQPRNPEANQDWLAQEVGRYGRGSNRILIDLPTASGATTRRILRLGPVVLVPVSPDMNSVVSVGAIEAFFRHSGNGLQAGGKQILPFYLLNQFDYSLPLHLDVREILREQIGDRLLPFALRRSPAVSEALAEGMTVIDYAPNASVAEDYAHLADWVRSLSAPATQSYRGVRWSER